MSVGVVYDPTQRTSTVPGDPSNVDTWDEIVLATLSVVDSWAVRSLRARLLLVDPETGAITTVDGKRAETVDRRDGSGRVVVRRAPRMYAPAHRVVFLAVHGYIPPRYSVRHLNESHWDNRPSNLYASPERGFVTYPVRVP
jgi:hypothetical protein